MKRFISVLILTFLFAVPSRASDLSDFNLNSITAADVAAGAEVPAPAKAARAVKPKKAVKTSAGKPSSGGLKEWTVMVYSTTKDQLRQGLMWQLLDMKRVGSTKKVNVVAEASLPVRHEDGSVSTDTIRIVLGKAGDEAELDRLTKEMFKDEGPLDEKVIAAFDGDIISRQSSGDTGDWKKAAAFTKWAKTDYPAKRYALYIYGHGNGFFDQKKSSNKGTLLDTDTKNYVTLPEMGLLMAETGKIDILLMTSCIMQMAEVAWQVKDYVDVIVGSSELIWSSGYDTVWLLETLNAQPKVPSDQLGAALVDSYVARVKALKKDGGHASVIVTSRLPDFAQKLNAWVDAEMALQDKMAVIKGINKTARFDIFGITMAASPAIARDVSVSGDLYDFVSIVGANTPRDTPERLLAVQKGQELMDFISKDLVYYFAYTGRSNTGFDFGRTHGISIHVPPLKFPFGSFANFKNALETQYWDLPFANETKWGEFLVWIYGRK